jgi:iron complex outermembrane receptor protein
VAGAQIVVAGTALRALTDDRGQYVIQSVPAGTHTLQVQQLGYREAKATVSVAGGGAATQNFRLVDEAVVLEEVVVTVGSRATHTAAQELAVPVDVFPLAEIQANPQVEMARVLQELVPSVSFPRPQIADMTSGVRPFTLRGLSPDHSLVLINGKRRHPTAVVHVFGGAALTSGSSGVDMNAIAPAAIGRMEVLRDGAAAQYGSDAIAGVVNVVLREDVHRPEFTASLGKYFPNEYKSDGMRSDVSGNWGVPIGSRGALHMTGALSQRDPTARACPDPRDQITPGDADVVEGCKIVKKNNPVNQPSHIHGDGEATNYLFFGNARYRLGETEDASRLYLFGGYSLRKDVHAGYFRRAIDARNWPTIYPNGFLPTFAADTRDISLTGGIQGRLGEWSYDVSGQWGQNRLDNNIVNTHNVSLGPCLDKPCAPGPDGILGTADDPGIPNKTAFYAGALELNQFIGSTDLVRAVRIGTASPLNVALGATVRADNYKVIAGEKGSWINGYHRNRNGGVGAVGAQVFAGYRPTDAVDKWRNNVGLFLDLETDLARNFLVATAARFENYSDFGSSLTGKVAVRFQPAEQFILRAAASTGFRAPALSQTYYAHTSTAFRNDGTGNQVGYEIVELPINAPEAKALGAKQLTEERSRHLSAGLAMTPAQNLNLTADIYHIRVDDRIILTGSLTGPTVRELLKDYTAEDVKFFTNMVDTRTWGVDLTTRYRIFFSQNKYVETLLSYNLNQNRVVGIHPPQVIAELKEQIFSRTNQTALEKGRPRDRLAAKLRFVQDGGFTANLGANYYGKVTSLVQENPDILYEYGAKTLFEAELGYPLTRWLDFSIGAENIFDVFPDKVPADNNYFGILPYSGSSFGYNGRYLYTRIRARTF